MESKILLVTGANGQLATEYIMSNPLKGWEYSFYTKEELDITDQKKIDNFFESNHFDGILNLAAYTNVEKAEKEETEQCYNVNAIGPKNLAIIANRYNIPIIHISTDYVFDGKKTEPYNEKDLEQPINHYGRTKFIGEKFIQEHCDWYFILRVSWVYSNNTKNFFTTMMNLAQERSEVNVVQDQVGSPTTTKEICRAIDCILQNLEKQNTGTYHFSGNGQTTWKDFAQEIFKQARLDIKVNGTLSTAWKSNVTRPLYTYMNSRKFTETFGYQPSHWKNALKEILAERKIIPIKVGDTVISDHEEHVIVSTDWLKRTAKISPLENMKQIIELPFDILIPHGK